MNQDTFTEERKDRWERLSALLQQIRKFGLKNLTPDEIRLLGSLYRKTCSDLSYARSKAYSRDLMTYLNQLVGQAYGVIYLHEGTEKKGNFLRFFTHTFPSLVRKHFSYILLSIIIFLFTTSLAYVWSNLDNRFISAVVPREFLQIWDRESRENMSRDNNMGTSAFPVMSSYYLTHNFQVGIFAFVGGIFLGLGTLYFMAYNGLIFGAITAMVVKDNFYIPFFSFVMSHSFVELMAIFICGGAGFLIASALISPGDGYRGDVLYQRGKESAFLVLGTIPMFLIAGIIESSISRIEALPLEIKILFALLTVVLMVLYFSYDPERKNKPRKFQLG